MESIITAPDKKCRECGVDMDKLWRCDPPPATFRGWYCTACNEIERPIGRENKFELVAK